MQKELNPELFGESSVMRTRVVDSGNSASGMSHQQVMQVDQKLAEMRSQVGGVVEQMNRLSVQLSDFMRVSQNKFEKLQGSMVQLEKNDQALSVDNTQKLTHLAHKLGERKTLDLKVQEMINRHNSVLKTYELRLSQLQKLISEREYQINATLAQLNETKAEIARMKRL